jgi:hypothetical protein
MTIKLQRRLAIAAGLLVLLAGAVYTLSQPKRYESKASVLLVPDTRNLGDASALLDSMERAGTMGTYAELIASHNTLERAGENDLEVETRPVPGSRVIEVTATAPLPGVSRQLGAVLAAAAEIPALTRDPWRLQVVETASADSVAGPGRGLLLLAVLVAAALATLAAFTVLGAVRRGVALESAAPATGGLHALNGHATAPAPHDRATA